jgi:5'(3')-deoxyribonucleotidase|tara:strand:+ start:293 stop:739 length:447 start_codon:yes stop_codon:yes gene_type:complete
MSLVYVDMDNVLVDFKSGMNKLGLDEKTQDPDEIEGIFSLMIPIPGAIEGYNKLNKLGHDVYILSTAPWENPSAWSDKLIWVKKYIGKIAHKKLILSHNKNLNKGDFLIDDRIANGAGDFKGELIRFGSEKFPNWDSVINYFENLKPN